MSSTAVMEGNASRALNPTAGRRGRDPDRPAAAHSNRTNTACPDQFENRPLGAIAAAPDGRNFGTFALQHVLPRSRRSPGLVSRSSRQTATRRPVARTRRTISARGGYHESRLTDSKPHSPRATVRPARSWGTSVAHRPIFSPMPGCTPGVNAPRTAFLSELMFHESSRPFLSHAGRGNRRRRGDLVHDAGRHAIRARAGPRAPAVRLPFPPVKTRSSWSATPQASRSTRATHGSWGPGPLPERLWSTTRARSSPPTSAGRPGRPRTAALSWDRA